MKNEIKLTQILHLNLRHEIVRILLKKSTRMYSIFYSNSTSLELYVY